MFARQFRVLAALAGAVVLAPIAASAQQTPPPTFFWPSPIYEGVVGYTGFADDGLVNHAIFGGSARFFVTRRIALGPEVVFMRGPGEDRDLFLTGTASIDLLPERGAVRRTVTPFLTAGGGLMRNTGGSNSRFSPIWTGALTGGGGVRIALGDRLFIAPEVRVGWEPHVRFSVTIGAR